MAAYVGLPCGPSPKRRVQLSTALRQTGTDYIGFVFYLPMYLLGTPVEVIVSVGSLNLVYQFWVHTEHVGRLGIFDYIFGNAVESSGASCEKPQLHR